MRRKPEVLAPAGDRASLAAALAGGADAVYFGLDEGFNARARADNFPLDRLKETVDEIHAVGARAYLTMNTLVFQPELPELERVLAEVARAGVDALIVQDPAVALLARQICPELELHASTQMTISSPEGARFAHTLGITRIVLPRELSVSEIRKMADNTDLELEVFIMGALCVSWSGQCLSSEAWGGRSANRGQCAQACRMPYELVVDGETRPLGDVQYLLSPKDLAGFRAVPDLIEAGVHTLKIEGRQKGPTYVHTATDSMRRWVDQAWEGKPDEKQLALDVRDLSLAYGRGFTDGFLAGSDHQTLVEGRYPRHRGLLLGVVTKVKDQSVVIAPEKPQKQRARGEVSSPLPAFGGATDAASGPPVAPPQVRPGMGIMFDEGKAQDQEQGGPIFTVARQGKLLELGFGQPGPDLRQVRPGARVWLTSDPELNSRTSRAVRSPRQGRRPVTMAVTGTKGAPLQIRSQQHTVETEARLQPATGKGLTHQELLEKLGALGGTPFYLEHLDTTGLEPGLFIPVSQLKQARRELIDRLSSPAARTIRRPSNPRPQLPRGTTKAARLLPLCRTDEQLEAVIESGLDTVILDWMELVGLNGAVRRARDRGLRVGLATVRIQKPGEEVYDKRLRALQPDLLLVRHWAGVMHEYQERPELHGDFSLNVTNAITAQHLLALGLDVVTAAHDLDERQLLELLAHMPPERLAVTVHHHIPTFHTEHCVYSNQLSEGRDYRSCGRPCEQHQVALRDHHGLEHPVIVDVGCRNTVFNAAAQTAASLVPRLLERGVRTFRVEFVRETREQARAVLESYRELLAGKLKPAEVVRRVGVHEQFGVTRGTMQVLLPVRG